MAYSGDPMHIALRSFIWMMLDSIVLNSHNPFATRLKPTSFNPIACQRQHLRSLLRRLCPALAELAQIGTAGTLIEEHVACALERGSQLREFLGANLRRL